MAGKGGWRPGAGRKSRLEMFNSLSGTVKRKFVLELINDDDVRSIVNGMIRRAKTDTVEAKYLIDQLIGRPLQATDVTSGGEKIESFNDGQIDRIARRAIAAREAADGDSSSTQTPD